MATAWMTFRRGSSPRLGAVAGTTAATGVRGLEAARVPVSDLQEHEEGDQRRAREPRDARLSVGDDHEGGEQWTRGGTDIPADLEQRLSEPIASAGSHARHAGGL